MATLAFSRSFLSMPSFLGMDPTRMAASRSLKAISSLSVAIISEEYTQIRNGAGWIRSFTLIQASQLTLTPSLTLLYGTAGTISMHEVLSLQHGCEHRGLSRPRSQQSKTAPMQRKNSRSQSRRHAMVPHDWSHGGGHEMSGLFVHTVEHADVLIFRFICRSKERSSAAVSKQ